jgi:hypothetical protein
MLTFHQEPRGNALVDWTPAAKTLETIKWMLNKEKYKIHHGLCTKFELNNIMTPYRLCQKFGFL